WGSRSGGPPCRARKCRCAADRRVDRAADPRIRGGVGERPGEAEGRGRRMTSPPTVTKTSAGSSICSRVRAAGTRACATARAAGHERIEADHGGGGNCAYGVPARLPVAGVADALLPPDRQRGLPSDRVARDRRDRAPQSRRGRGGRMRAPVLAGLRPWLRPRFRPLLRLQFRGRGAEIAAGPPAVWVCGPDDALTSISLSIPLAVREPITYSGGSSS